MSNSVLRGGILIWVALLALPAGGLTATQTPDLSFCPGDCDADHQVRINELLLGVRVASGLEPPAECPGLDGDGDGAVEITELIQAVRRALEGCGATPTPVRPTGDAFEPDDTAEEARAIACGELQTHRLSPNGDDNDWLEFTLDRPYSSIRVATASVMTVERELLSGAGTPLTELQYYDIERTCGVDAIPAGTYRVRLTGFAYSDSDGTYTVALICGECGGPNATTTPTYTPTPSPTAVLADQYEPDDSAAQATTVECGSLQRRSFASTDDVDWLRFTLTEPANSVSLTTFGGYVQFALRADGVLLEQTSYGLERSCANGALPPGEYTLELQTSPFQGGFAYDLALVCGTCDALPPSPTATPSPTAIPTLPQPDAFEPDDDAEHAVRIACGEVQTHTLSPGNDSDWLLFTTEAPFTAVTINTTVRQGAYPELRLQTAAGTRLAAGNSFLERRCGENALVPGDYRVRLSRYFYDAGSDYDVELRCMPCDAANATTTPTPTPTRTPTAPRPDAYEPDDTRIGARSVECGIGEHHTLAPASDRDWLRVTLTEPSTRMRVVAYNTYGSTQLTLTNASGAELAQGQYAIERQCGYDALSPGDYFVSVSGFTPSAYDLVIICSACDEANPTATRTPTPTPTAPVPRPDAFEPDNELQSAAPIACGETQLRSLAPGGDADWVRFTLGAAYTNVRLEAAYTDGNVDLYVQDGAGNQISYYANPIEWRCGQDALAAGEYAVRLSGYSYSNQGGLPYVLTLRCTPCALPNPTATPTATASPTATAVEVDAFEPDFLAPPVLACGELQVRSLAPAGDRDRTRLVLAEDSAVLLETRATEGYVNFVLRDSGGVTIGGFSGSRTYLSCEQGGLAAGEYLLELDGYGYTRPEVGYSQSLLCLPCAGIVPTRTPTPTPMPTGTLAPGETPI